MSATGMSADRPHTRAARHRRWITPLVIGIAGYAVFTLAAWGLLWLAGDSENMTVLAGVILLGYLGLTAPTVGGVVSLVQGVRTFIEWRRTSPKIDQLP